MKIQTGSNSINGGSQGYLSVKVNGNLKGQNGFFKKHGWFNTNQIVLQSCFDDLTDIRVQNNNTDAWAGTVVVKRNGEEVPLFCDGCGGSPFDKKIAVDGNADGTDQAPTYCLHGKQCILTLEGKNATKRRFDVI